MQDEPPRKSRRLARVKVRSLSSPGGYIERGETDKTTDWAKFEQASGCKVNVKTANTSDEMVALR
jgi:spermidine/putrescine-binding protein